MFRRLFKAAIISLESRVRQNDHRDLSKKIAQRFANMKNIAYLCNAFRKQRELSSAGSERLPYKQRVGGSNPSAPTENETILKSSRFFVYATLSIAAKFRIIRQQSIFHKTGKPRRNSALSSAAHTFSAPAAFNEQSAGVCGPQPRPASGPRET